MDNYNLASDALVLRDMVHAWADRYVERLGGSAVTGAELGDGYSISFHPQPMLFWSDEEKEDYAVFGERHARTCNHTGLDHILRLAADIKTGKMDVLEIQFAERVYGMRADLEDMGLSVPSEEAAQ